MNTSFLIKSIFLLPLTCGLCLAATVQDAFQELFDGKTLNGWEGASDYWRVEDGSIDGEIPEGEALEKTTG